MLAKESKEAFENVREDFDKLELRVDELSNEQTADSVTLKNKMKDLVMEVALVRQAVQTKDIASLRSQVMSDMQRTQTQFEVANKGSGGAVNNRLNLIEARMADLQKMMMSRS